MEDQKCRRPGNGAKGCEVSSIESVVCKDELCDSVVLAVENSTTRMV